MYIYAGIYGILILYSAEGGRTVPLRAQWILAEERQARQKESIWDQGETMEMGLTAGKK